MPLLIILLLALAIALIGSCWGAAIIIAGFTFLAVVLIFAAGGFQPCPKCGSRLTTQFHKDVPDFSLGNQVMHVWSYQTCWHPKCRKTTMLHGVKVDSR